MLMYGWEWLAGLWLAGEALQWAMILKARAALRLGPPSAFALEVGAKLKEFEHELDILNGTINVIATDDTLEEDLREETVRLLIIEKETLVKDIEAYITKVALEEIAREEAKQNDENE